MPISPKVLVTGAAGFIGAETVRRLLSLGFEVVGIDNMNAYYAVSLKEARLARITAANFRFIRGDITDKELLEKLFREEHFEAVVHLAAQAGVRYSLENPQTYIDSNITGFLNILECCRRFSIPNLVYASSSSVYGRNDDVPFKVSDRVDKPSSLYAVTKRTNELMADTYHHLYQVNCTGLRFFTVYGPWGRPDMAPWIFAEKMMKGLPIQVFNHGNMSRDFTFVEDIVEGIVLTMRSAAGREKPEHKIYNIGRGVPVNLLDFILELEHALGKTAVKEFLPMQPGDVEKTWADTEALSADTGYQPKTSLHEGVKHFAGWFTEYFHE
ncbi:MAG: SDR family NAD(P)-dependent oxidoreductase [Fibrobacter sp.]|jgi:UDP-glucuronate 4-epimerase|nr:SDR family NAD(P)-dependent oxidoreductase [Fibrobacter sp.]